MGINLETTRKVKIISEEFSHKQNDGSYWPEEDFATLAEGDGNSPGTWILQSKVAVKSDLKVVGDSYRRSGEVVVTESYPIEMGNKLLAQSHVDDPRTNGYKPKLIHCIWTQFELGENQRLEELN